MSPRLAHEDLLACDLALGGTAGTFLVLGEPPPVVVMGLGACASGLTFLARESFVNRVRATLDPCSPASVSVLEPQGGPLTPHQNLLAWDTPRDPGLLEAALNAVVDQGGVFVSLPREGAAGPKPDLRRERLVASACGDAVTTPAHAPRERQVLYGERVAMTPDGTEDPHEGALPVSVIVVSRGDTSALESLLCDVLLRQRFPPEEVFVMDCPEEDGQPAPENLFGLPALSHARTILVSCAQTNAVAALNDALGGVSAPYVATACERGHLAANHLTALGMVLEAREERVAVSGLCAETGTDGAVIALARKSPAHMLASLFRTQAVRDVGGFSASPDAPASLEFWGALEGAGELESLLMPLASMPADIMRGRART